VYGEPSRPRSRADNAFVRTVNAKVDRKLRAQRNGTQGAWSGLGVFGLIGWSVATPTFLGAMLGVWLDRHRAGAHSWTLTLLIAGLSIGCASAWHWVSVENRAIQEDSDDKNA
jgi:ATP synthase protein I